MMDLRLLAWSEWAALASSRREEVARVVAAELPAPFAFAGLHACEMDGTRHEAALFNCEDAGFALVPGGEVTLGYDRTHPFVPTDAQRQAWARDRRENGLPELNEYLEDRLTPLRTVTFQPFLLEIEANPSLRSAPVDAPWLLAEGRCLQPGEIRELADAQTGRNIWLAVDDQGRLLAAEDHPLFHHDALSAVASEGFRLPTSDEWEHACAAGARTLFRWGNDCPAEEYPSEIGESTWDLHRRPNRLGLHIAHDPYHWEVCAEPGVMRGGDGGKSTCWASGCLSAWIALASAYVQDRDPAQLIYGAYLRRAYSLS
jgi:hypothetical protein